MIKKEITKEDIDKYKLEELIGMLGIKTKITMDFLKLFLNRIDEKGKTVESNLKFKSEYTMTKEQLSLFKINKTTIGKLIFNSFTLPKEYIDNFGYVNETISGSNYSTIHSNLAILLQENTIASDEYADTIDRITWLGMNMTNFKGLCMDFKSINMSKEFLDKKNKVYKELKDKNASGDEILAAEDKLLDEASKEKKGTGLLKIIKSGSKGSMTNNYKVLNVGRGIIKNGSGDLVLLNRSLAEGNKTSDYVQLSNNSILGTYGRSMKTAQGGYLTKLVSSGFSYLNIDINNPDCGTKGFLKFKFNESDLKIYLNRNIRIVGSNKWEILTSKNYKKYSGKEVEMRTPMFCHSKDGICPTCYGGLYNINKIDKGLSVIITDLTSKIMNTSMKSVASAYSDICIKQCELSGKLSA